MLHHELYPYNSINEWFEVHDELNIQQLDSMICVINMKGS